MGKGNTHAQSRMETKIELSIASHSRGRATTTQIVGYTNNKPKSLVKPTVRQKSWIKATIIHIPAEIGPLEAVSPARCMHNQEEPWLVHEEDELTSAYASLVSMKNSPMCADEQTTVGNGQKTMRMRSSGRVEWMEIRGWSGHVGKGLTVLPPHSQNNNCPNHQKPFPQLLPKTIKRLTRKDGKTKQGGNTWVFPP